MLWNREEYISHMTFKGSPREMFTELFGPLIGLDAEWRSQGATDKEIDLSAFGWDAVKYKFVPFDCKPRSGIKPVILSETEDEQVSIDSMGRKMRLSRKCSTIPLPFSYPVETPEDWDRVKGWYKFTDDRLDIETIKQMKKLRDEGTLINFEMPGGFDEIRCLMGEENLCYAMIDEPEMIEDMLATFGALVKEGMERTMEYVGIDELFVHEDMAGISGPLIGPKHVKQYISPYYKAMWETAKQGGATLFSQDSDGNMEAVIDTFLETGLNIMYPAEPKAGMDIVKLRQKYGTKVAFKGGIDKFALRGTKEDVRKELEYKMSAPMLGGGTIFALDHRIPNGVPIENYRYYVKLGRELLGLPEATESAHIRMAF